MTLHPQAQQVIEMFDAAGFRPLWESTPEDARALLTAMRAAAPPPEEIAEARDIEIPAEHGNIPARLFRAVDEPAGVIVYFHAGGWVVGSVDDSDRFTRELARRTECVVVSVDYRLAPEHRFPAAADDSYAALEWVSEHVADGRPIVVMGDSAGGNLAAVVARRSRDRGGPAIALQVLVYPVTDHDFTTGSYEEHGDTGLPLGKADMIWFWDHYVPDATVRSDPDVSPLRTEDLSGLPPAHVVVAGNDPLHDEGKAYADRLEDAGSAVTFEDYDDQMHGFIGMLGLVDAADQALNRAAAEIRAAVGAATAAPGA